MRPGDRARAARRFPTTRKLSRGRRTYTASAQPLPHHAAPQIGDLGLQRQLLRADIVATEQAHAAEHAGVVADQIEEIGVVALPATGTMLLMMRSSEAHEIAL